MSLPAASQLLPSVLKLTSAPSLQVKTLVYLITLRLAPSHPDVTLLSINSFQRDLSDSRPLIRGMALRVLSGLAVKMAAPLMQMAIAKSVRDPSFYVRRIAADAIGKCYDLERSSLPDLLPHLSTLLGDRHPSVLGSALLAFQCTTPHRHELLHPHFRRICTALVDIDEWNQPCALGVLAAYARVNLPRPTPEQTSRIADSEKAVPGRTRFGQSLDKDFDMLLARAEPLLSSRNPAVVLSTAHFYLSLLPISAAYLSAALPSPLLTLVRLHPSHAYLALLFIRRLHSLRADLFAFASHAHAFIPRSLVTAEPPYISAEKLDLLVDLCIADGGADAYKLALSELQEATLHRREDIVVSRGVRALGRIARRGGQDRMEKCIDVLLQVVKEHRAPAAASASASASASAPTVVHQAMIVIGELLGGGEGGGEGSESDRSRRGVRGDNGDDADEKSLARELGRGQILYKLSLLLFKNSDSAPASTSTSSSPPPPPRLAKTSITDHKGRSAIYHLLGQYCRSRVPVQDDAKAQTSTATLAETVLPELLRKSALHFERESTAVKLAILTFSAKLLVVAAGGDGGSDDSAAVSALHAHVLQLARCDAVFEVRDRARFYGSLTAGVAVPRGLVGGGDDDSENADPAAADADAAAGGVRLRREQVMMVLFGGGGDDLEVDENDDDNLGPQGKAVTSSSPPSVDASAILDPVFLASTTTPAPPPRSHRLPPWTADASTLPPSSVRDPTAAAAAVVSTTASTSALAVPSPPSAVRSLSSDQIIGGASSSSGTSTPLGAAGAGAGPSFVARTASPLAPPQGKGKYKDLDDFLNESSGDEEEVEEAEEEEEEESVSSSSEESSEVDDEEDEEETESESESESENEEDAALTAAPAGIPRISGELVQNQWA